jgi:heat shock protein HslJ
MIRAMRTSLSRRSSRPIAVAAALLSAACASNPPVQDRTWYWLDTRPPEAYTLQIQDGRAAIRADCNRGTGAVTLEGERLSFGPIAMTRAFCRPPSKGDEFARALQRAERLEVHGGTLRLTLKHGEAMFFADDPRARLASYRCPGQQVLSVVYAGDTAQVWFGGEHFALRRARAASGARYADGAVALHTQGVMGTLRKGDAVLAQNCQLPSH